MGSGSQELSAPLARGSGEADSMVSLGGHFKAPSSKTIYDPAVLQPQVVLCVLQVFPNCGEQTLQARCWSREGCAAADSVPPADPGRPKSSWTPGVTVSLFSFP